MRELRVELAAGVLRLHMEREDIACEHLCGFASRRNRRRGFLFVSKVLGKHIPACPLEMRRLFTLLAAKITLTPSPMVFVGVAETAIGLAQFIYEAFLSQRDAPNSLFLHTTRHRFQAPLAVEFCEPHSHAPQHSLYWPRDEDQRRLLRAAVSLVLIDDELSTGVTLGNLARALTRLMPNLRHVQVVSLTNWSSPQARLDFAANLPGPVEFHSLLDGHFDFEPNPEYEPAETEAAPPSAVFVDSRISRECARFGRIGAASRRFDTRALTRDLSRSSRLLVLGTGEFLHAPFLLALALAEDGFDVRFQSTTRSPISLGRDIHSVCEFTDPIGENLVNFVYNVVDKSYSRIFVAYEVATLPGEHDLPRRLGAVPLHFVGEDLAPGNP